MLSFLFQVVWRASPETAEWILVAFSAQPIVEPADHAIVDQSADQLPGLLMAAAEVLRFVAKGRNCVGPIAVIDQAGFIAIQQAHFGFVVLIGIDQKRGWTICAERHLFGFNILRNPLVQADEIHTADAELGGWIKCWSLPDR